MLVMISHEYTCIFIHIGKTGGTSIEHFFNPDVKLDSSKSTRGTGNTDFKGKHYSAIQYKNEFESIFDLYFKFAFVRNPWDLEISLWKWFDLCFKKKKSFKKHLESRQGSMGFARWICDSSQTNLVEFIGRFENRQEEFNIVCDKIGIPQQKLPHKNKTKHKHYTEYYDDESREIVAEKYTRDIEYFGYKFGE